MKFCFHCGKELNDEAAFCPFCGGALRKEEPVSQAQPVTNRMDGGTRGKGIASVALGGSGLFFAAFSLFFFLFEFIFSFAFRDEVFPVGALFLIYVLCFSLIALGCGIAGRLLGSRALETKPDYKLAKIGSTLSLAGIIAAGAVSALGFMLLLV